MMKTMTWSAAAVLTLTLSGSFAPLAAQSAVAERAVEVERADVLAQHGRTLAELGQDFRGASRALREAAELRGSDPRSVDDLVRAGHFSYYGGERLTAAFTLARAAGTAAAIGDAAGAAEAYLDAAWVAHEAGRDGLAVEFLKRGEDMTLSASVAPDDRAVLLARIGSLR